MNRFYLMLTLILFVKVSVSQDTTFTISKIVTVDSISKEELFGRAKLWVATSYNSAKNVVQLDDKENTTIVIKALFPVTAKAGLMIRMEQGNVKYTLTIQCKDGRYKYTLTDFIHECHTGYGSGGNLSNEIPDCGYGRCPKGGWMDIKGQGETYIKNLEISIVEGMSNKSKSSKNDDW